MSERGFADQHIHDMTGIWPDPRFRVPVEETVANIQRVKQGDEAAGIALASQRLRWAYSTYATPEMSEQTGLEPQDIMQSGVIATIDVARELQVKRSQPENQFRRAVEDRLNTELKRLSPDANVLADKELHDAIEGDRTAERPSVESEVFGKQVIAHEALIKAFTRLTPRGRNALAAYYGIGRLPMKQSDIADKLGVTTQAISLILGRQQDKIQEFELDHRLGSGLSAVLGTEDVTNRGLVPSEAPPQFSPEGFTRTAIINTGGWPHFKELFPEANKSDYFL